eukprot:CAMPEP_0195302512 /NCGR_PEP_ID=MMETSP0707-20130614/31227_1 /TAXON_ID=33640 /ORGANISM="Asterionellopsis glacialis, Strain CCMP134" /LENGTH=402 /DNA_ID=CAMNT_0040365789 /DNA_START=145 /DNA_END=1354 /DNA_ORIENTATION=-
MTTTKSKSFNRLYVSAAPQNNNDVAKEDDDELSPEDIEFFQKNKIIIEERNLPLEKVKNARDLSSPEHSPIGPGRVLRMGRLSDATEQDIQILLKDLNIQTLVDLRSPTELKDDPTLEREEVFGNFTSMIWTERGRGKDGCLRELKQGEAPVRARGEKRKWFHGKNSKPMTDDEILDEEDDCDVCAVGSVPVSQVRSEQQDQNRKERHFVSLMNEFKYVKGTISKVRKRDLASTVLKGPAALLSKRVRDNIKEPFLDKINDGGLPMLNELLLKFGAPGIKYVLELCADKSRHPVAFYCTAGKDRTGMITAILLALCGVPTEDIIEDYSLSANVYAEMNDHKAMVGALSQRNLDPKTFLCAPPQVMRDTLEIINNEYGSVEEYLSWIGFDLEDQKKLRDALMS